MRHIFFVLSIATHFCSSRFFASATTETLPQIYSKTVTIDGAFVGILSVLESEEPTDAVFHFAQKHGLNQKTRGPILHDVCLQIKCERKHAFILKSPVLSDDGKELGHLEILEGTEPADIVQIFALKHKFSKVQRDGLLQNVCGLVKCTRLKPLVWKKELVIDSTKSVVIEVEEGQEPADVIFRALKPFNLLYSQRRLVMEQVKKENVPHTRENAFVFDQRLVVDNETSYQYQLFDDGSEPIDRLYQFARANKLESYWDQLATAVFPATCLQVLCQRQDPLLWTGTIKRENGTAFGVASVFKGQEPIDAVDAFCQVHQLSKRYREEIIKAVCTEISCLRDVPVVYRKKVDNESGVTLGMVEVMEDEELTDALTRFLSSTALSMEEPRLREYFFQDACGNPRIKCSKPFTINYDNRLVDENGTELGQLYPID